MHQPQVIYHRELVAIVRCAKAQHLSHECCLSTEAASRNQDRASLPPNHPSVQECHIRRRFRDMQVQVSLKRFQHQIQASTPRQSSTVCINDVETSHSG